MLKVNLGLFLNLAISISNTQEKTLSEIFRKGLLNYFLVNYQRVIFAPRTFKNSRIQAGWPGQAGEVTKLPST